MSKRIQQSAIEIIVSKCVEQTVLATLHAENPLDLRELEGRLVEVVRDELYKAGALVQRKRRARVTRGVGVNLAHIQGYLPGNYGAREIINTGNESCILIEGYDRAGWTLDGYVIPRLASGLIVAKEVS